MILGWMRPVFHGRRCMKSQLRREELKQKYEKEAILGGMGKVFVQLGGEWMDGWIDGWLAGKKKQGMCKCVGSKASEYNKKTAK